MVEVYIFQSSWPHLLNDFLTLNWHFGYKSFESMQGGLCLYTLVCSTNMFILISILQSWLLYIFIKDETHSLSPLTLYSFAKVVFIILDSFLCKF